MANLKPIQTEAFQAAQFQAQGAVEELAAKPIAVRLSASDDAAIRAMPNRAEFVRSAVAAALRDALTPDQDAAVEDAVTALLAKLDAEGFDQAAREELLLRIKVRQLLEDAASPVVRRKLLAIMVSQVSRMDDAADID